MLGWSQEKKHSLIAIKYKVRVLNLYDRFKPKYIKKLIEIP